MASLMGQDLNHFLLLSNPTNCQILHVTSIARKKLTHLQGMQVAYKHGHIVSTCTFVKSLQLIQYLPSESPILRGCKIFCTS